MNLQLILDARGNDAGVFIPMDDWTLIKINYPGIDCFTEEKTIAYTTSGQPLTKSQYQALVNEGIRQCKEGKYTSLEQLSEDLGYNYADL